MISLQSTVSVVESSKVLQCATRSGHVCTMLFSFSLSKWTKFFAFISGAQFNLRIEGTPVDNSSLVSINSLKQYEIKYHKVRGKYNIIRL